MKKLRNIGGTLAEIMTLAAMAGLLVVMALPGFIRAGKQSKGVEILKQAKQISTQVDRFATAKDLKIGDSVDTNAVAAYYRLAPGAWPPRDLLRNEYSINAIGTGQVHISPVTKEALKGVGLDWSWY